MNEWNKPWNLNELVYYINVFHDHAIGLKLAH